MKLSGARIVLECIKREGVDLIFGLPGGAVLPIYDALYDFEGLRHVLVRQEAAAGHAADGYARTTGKVGVCLVTSGPAATNLSPRCRTAQMDSIPIVAFTGQVADQLDRQRRLPGGRHHRHHPPLHQAQLPGQGRQGPRPASSRRRSTSRATGRPGPVLRRPAQGHPGQGVDLRVSRSACTCARYNPTYEGHPGQIKKAARAMVRGQAPGALRGRRRHLVRRLTRAARAGRPDPDPGHPDPDGPGLVPDGGPALARHARHARHLLRQHGGAPLATAWSRSPRASTTG